ncbi:hypothetical protein BDV93DRAFT_562817 [Ceratobasidium sp. AG-I]|nr:hypothetical protein BDV93DRAFT_562817 [Ceratobasidium sp. AG-I]
MRDNPDYFLNRHFAPPDPMLNILEGGIPDRLVHEAMAHTNHKAIKPARSASPFQDAEIEDKFSEVLASAMDLCEIPVGYGVLPTEWDQHEHHSYPSSGTITVGTHKQSHAMCMPVEVWLPRAQKWAIGLDELEHFCHNQNVHVGN